MVGGQLYVPVVLSPMIKPPITYFIGGWVGYKPPRYCGEEKYLVLLPEIEARFLAQYTG
jgi:hypothetical protein